MGPSLLVTGCEPGSTCVSHRATINRLPQELIVIIFRICLNSVNRVEVRTRLTLVCRIWNAIIEGTPSFWTLIQAADGIQNARNAITKTGELPIDLTLHLEDPVLVDQFLAVVSEKVSQWRSVEFTFDGVLAGFFSGLQASACHSLEKLRLTWYDSSYRTAPLALFGGGPAPDGLKDVYLYGVPADLARMQLSKLSSLDLIDVPYVEMDDILLILRNSPTLTTLHLRGCGRLHPLGASVGLPIILGSLKACSFDLSVPSIHFLLSAIHAPSLDDLELTVDTEDSFPHSSIFTPPVPGFGPTMERLLSTAKHIELEIGDPDFVITFGGLEIVLVSPDAEGFQYVRDVLDRLMDYSGEKGKELKVHLHLDSVDPTIEELQLFNRSPMVEQLTLTEELWSGSIPISATEALGTRIAAGQHGWLFPELEFIDWNMNLENIGELEMALEKRYCAAQSTQQGSAEENQHPRLLKELRFFSEDMPETGPVDMEGARRFHVLAGGATKIFVRNALVDFDTPES
ncbi:hypothetical protein FRC00_000435 [Tulasnella sp. 408]|nr:hypothetical protein FRC00_000435 [Tulasnella sp. 408]